MDVQYSEGPVLFERRRIVAELVEKDTQCPYIALLVDRPTQVNVNHFRSPILQRRMSVQIGLQSPNLLNVVGYALDRSCAPEIAEFVRIGAGLQDILDFEIAVEEGRFQCVHGSEPFAYVNENLEDFMFCEPFA